MGASQREIWIDVARGLGIIAVVVAHVLVDTNPGNSITWFLFLFHMPLFFILAGMNQKPVAFGPFLKRRGLQLLVPYVFYIALFTAPSVARWMIELLRGHVEHPVNWASVIWGGDQLGGATGVLWFLTCLFFAQAIYTLLLNRFGSAANARLIAIVVAAVVIAYLLSFFSISLPLALNIVPAALLFIWIGNMVGRQKVGHVVAGASVVLSLTLLFGCVALGYSTSFDMKGMSYGVIGAGFAIAALLSFATFYLSQSLGASPIAQGLAYLGKASLVIMALHQGIRFAAQSVIGAEPISLILIAVAASLVVYEIARRTPVLSELMIGAPRSSSWLIKRPAEPRLG